MKLPDEQTWLRVEALADELGSLSREEAAAAMSRLQEAGEPPTILSYVANWLALPPLSSGLEPGCILANRYKLLGKLGEGAMGCVWRAKQELIGREVALKIIHPILVTPALEARFIHEIELLGKLAHGGIVRIYDAGFHERPNLPSLPFFTMELIEGFPLSSWSRFHRTEAASLLQLMSKVCDALQFAHERQIVHRDLKPANILVKQDGTPVVLDFGIAGLAGMGAGGDAELFSGTPQYAAPEQHLCRDWDFRTGESVDVYAIGAILFEILAGRRMFEFGPGTSLAEMRRRILEEPRPLLAEYLKDCPALLNELVGRATRRNPADRYYSIGALGRALLRVVEAYSPNPPGKDVWNPHQAGVVPGSRWRLETKIGEGGAGEVWAAIHEDLQQRAVFKFCNSEEKARTLKRELTFFRLLKERVGRNSHFIQLEDVSLDEPPYFLRMAYSEARELEVWCRSHPGGLSALDEAVRLEIVAQTAEALQAAHEAGILHRDIKPSNLLIQSKDSPAGVHVFVADFGIGQLLTEQLIRHGTLLGFTRTVEDLRTTLAGTMLYLAPEVLEGNEATVRSDIYSIGVLFWQLLVGNLRMALDPSDWAARIQDPLLRDDLRRCLAGNPEERWASAGELANSLRALPERRAAAIKRQRELEMRERAAYRNGVLRTAMVALVVIVLLVALAWFALAKSREAEKERNALAVSKTRNTLEALKALVKLKDGSAKELLARERPTLDVSDPKVKSELRDVASAILALPTFSRVKLPFELSDNASLGEDGERLVMVDTNGEPSALDLSVSPPVVTKLYNGTGVSKLRINAFGTAAGGIDAGGNLRLWYGHNFSQYALVSGPIYAGCFALSPSALGNSKVAFAAARPDGTIDVSPLGTTSAPTRLFRGASEASDNFPLSRPATMLAFSMAPEGILAAAGPTSGMVLFWKISDNLSATNQDQLASCAWHPDVITSLAWDPVDAEIATGCQDGLLRIWAFTQTGNVPQTKPSRFAPTGEPIRDIAWSSSGELIAVLADSGNIRVFWSRNPDQSVVTPLRLAGATHIAFALGGTLVAWGPDVSDAWGNEQSVFSERRISRNEVYVCFHQDGCLTATATERVHFLNPHNLTRTASFKAAPLGGGYWHEDTFHYHEGEQGKSVRLSRTAHGRFLKMPSGPSGGDGVAETWPSPCGNRAACFDNQLFWITNHGRSEGAQLSMAVKPRIVAVSDNSPTAAWGGDRLTLNIRNLARTNAPTETETNQDGILDLAFAPNQNVLAVRTGSAVQLIALDSNKRRSYPINAPAQSFSPVVFSPDGCWLAVCAADNSICLAPVRSELQALSSGRETSENIFTGALRLASPERRAIISLCWNAKGDRVAAGSAEGFVSCWNVSLLRRQLRLWNLDRDDEPLPEEPRFLAIKREVK